MTDATLVILSSLCAILGSISVVFDSFRHRTISVIAIVGGLGPWIAMLLFYRIPSSELAAWSLVLSGPILSLVAGIGYLYSGAKVASLLMWICFFVSVGWLTAYLSALGMAHV
ncbi:MAG: hypothetical protein CMO55_21555 [Verrucomicrobiales bacterium]|nr:hypothetical protein [Verrucomicrobiales bacterium]